jgi:hypothetical protein
LNGDVRVWGPWRWRWCWPPPAGEGYWVAWTDDVPATVGSVLEQLKARLRSRVGPPGDWGGGLVLLSWPGSRSHAKLGHHIVQQDLNQSDSCTDYTKTPRIRPSGFSSKLSEFCFMVRVGIAQSCSESTIVNHYYGYHETCY